MQDRFVAEGSERYEKATQAELQRAIAAKYADQLKNAGFFRRLIIRYLMWRELRKADPSRYTLWSHR